MFTSHFIQTNDTSNIFQSKASMNFQDTKDPAPIEMSPSSGLCLAEPVWQVSDATEALLIDEALYRPILLSRFFGGSEHE